MISGYWFLIAVAQTASCNRMLIRVAQGNRTRIKVTEYEKMVRSTRWREYVGEEKRG